MFISKGNFCSCGNYVFKFFNFSLLLNYFFEQGTKYFEIFSLEFYLIHPRNNIKDLVAPGCRPLKD